MAASSAMPTGTRRRLTARRRQCSTTGSTPRTGWIRPSSESSPQGYRVLDERRLDDAGGREDAQRHGKIEGRADLAHLCGRQVDHDPIHGKLEPAIPDRGAHAVAALTHGGVGQPNCDKGRQAGGDVDLYEDVVGPMPNTVARAHARQHGSSVGTLPRIVKRVKSVAARSREVEALEETLATCASGARGTDSCLQDGVPVPTWHEVCLGYTQEGSGHKTARPERNRAA
jgi:hypothetical protein